MMMEVLRAPEKGEMVGAVSHGGTLCLLAVTTTLALKPATQALLSRRELRKAPGGLRTNITGQG